MWPVAEILAFVNFVVMGFHFFFYNLFSISLLLTECHFFLVFIDFVAFDMISWIFRCFVLFHVLNKTLQKLTSPKSVARNLVEKSVRFRANDLLLNQIYMKNEVVDHVF